MHHENRIWTLMSRKFSGEATPQEIAELQELIGENIENEYIYQILQTYWTQDIEDKEDNDEIQRRFNRIINKPQYAAMRAGTEYAVLPAELLPPVKSNRNPVWWYVAAACIVVALAGAYFYFMRSSSTQAIAHNVALNEVVSRKGTRSKLVLPDGTQVWLNAESKLTYENAFNGTNRDVYLEGEAFFDVVKDKERPFIVHALGINVKVLGTAFNVRSYHKDSTVETTLLRGMVEVVRKNNPTGPKIILHPHEKLVLNKNDRFEQHKDSSGTKKHTEKIAVITLLNNKADSTIAETAWIYNKLIFEGDNFRELADKMERFYNVTISITDPRLLKFRFKGSFENETVEQALAALQLTNNFLYKITGNEIKIYSK